MRRAKNTYLKPDLPKTGTFYETGTFIADYEGTKFPLYSRGKANFHVDIPIGQNDIGIIHRGHFIRLFAAHPSTLDFLRGIDRIEKVIEKQKASIVEESDRLLKNFWNIKAKWHKTK